MNEKIKLSLKFRWSDYFLRHGDDFHLFWEDYLQKNTKNVLFILGQGFDPRMCIGLEKIIQAGGSGLRDCVAIEFDEGPNSPSKIHSPLLEDNTKKLDGLIRDKGTKFVKSIKMWTDENRRIGSRRAAEIFTGMSDFSNYTDIIIDISSLPRGIYFPLIGKILYILDSCTDKTSMPNLHLIVAENAELDFQIKEEEIDENADFIRGFAGNFEIESTENLAKVWIPILGEEKEVQLNRIYKLVIPEEICPVLPSPSVDPRRGDKLLIEYRNFLFEQLRVEPNNIIYVAEQNPFEVYRSIYQTILHYNEVFKPIGGCKIAISALSSKLISIGALLAAYESKQTPDLNVGIANVEAQGYQLNKTVEPNDSELFTLWLAGDCYEPSK